MFYNQNYENSYNFDSRKNNNKEDECRKGYCTIKVIQECCYPSYWDYEEKDDKRDDCNKHNYKKEENCCCKQEKKEEHNCCCKKEEKWEDKNSCNYNHKEQKRCCGICSCFRRW